MNPGTHSTPGRHIYECLGNSTTLHCGAWQLTECHATLQRFWGSEVIRQHPGAGPRPSEARLGVIWIMGDEALAMEQLSDEELHSDVEAILAAFPAIQLPKGFRVHRSKWGTDELFRGSYAFAAAGCTSEDFGTLAAPVEAGGRPVLLFAGDACHLQNYGCTSAACFTGQDAARVVLKGIGTTPAHQGWNG